MVWKAPKHEIEPELRNELDALKRIREGGRKILVRPNGEIAGIVVKEEPYQDPERNRKRRRLVYYGTDGELHKEPRDGFSKKTDEKIDLITGVEMDGGVALTQLTNPGGDVQPIITGPDAERIKVAEEDYKALDSEYRRLEKEYKSKERNYRKLQKQRSAIETERDELEEDLEDISEDNERLTSLVRKHKTRANAAEMEKDMLKREMRGLAERHEQLEQEVQEALESSRERAKAEIQAAPPIEEGGGRGRRTPEAEAEGG